MPANLRLQTTNIFLKNILLEKQDKGKRPPVKIEHLVSGLVDFILMYLIIEISIVKLE
jgi:hypothetical protein